MASQPQNPGGTVLSQAWPGNAPTFQLLSGKMEVGSVLVEGTLNGEPHFWNQLTADGGAHYVDLTRDASGTTYSAADLSPWATCGRARKKMQKI